MHGLMLLWTAAFFLQCISDVGALEDVLKIFFLHVSVWCPHYNMDTHAGKMLNNLSEIKIKVKIKERFLLKQSFSLTLLPTPLVHVN